MKKYNFVFLANGHKTKLYQHISQVLCDRGYSVAIVLTNPSFLDKSLFSEEIFIFDKNRHYESRHDVGHDFMLKRFIDQDRVLSKNKDSLIYLQRFQDFICSFLSENEVKVLVSEFTWAWELLCKDLADILGISHVAPFRTRFPDDRVFWTDCKFNSRIIQLSEELVPEIELKKPAYIEKSVKNLKVKLGLRALFRAVHRFWRPVNFSKSDIMQFTSFTTRFVNAIKPTYFKLTTSFMSYDEVKGEQPFYLYTMHKQPESSIDVLGYYDSNQFALIERLNNIIEPDVRLYVKPHILSTGDFDFMWYSKLKKLGVGILHPNQDIYNYLDLDTLKAVFTVSGTIALECHLKSKRAYVFSEIFSRLQHVVWLKWADVIKAKSLTELDVLEGKEIFSDWLKYSRKLNISDPNIDSSVLSRENITAWADSLLELKDLE
jgi:hypothetical protein